MNESSKGEYSELDLGLNFVLGIWGGGNKSVFFMLVLFSSLGEPEPGTGEWEGSRDEMRWRMR